MFAVVKFFGGCSNISIRTQSLAIEPQFTRAGAAYDPKSDSKYASVRPMLAQNTWETWIIYRYVQRHGDTSQVSWSH